MRRLTLFLAPLLIVVLCGPAQAARNDDWEPELLVAHVHVLLCDNDHQGIVPVPTALGNGTDPGRNLYWGALYGVKAFFSKSGNWKLLSCGAGPRDEIMERCVFEHRSGDAVMVADAWRGDAGQAFLDAWTKGAAGLVNQTLALEDGRLVGLEGSADLLAWVGHNLLMDGLRPVPAENTDGRMRQTIILGCAAKSWFGPLLTRAKANPLLWTTGLMAPEAYTLEAALNAWAKAEPATEIALQAARIYASYQKCRVAAARKLLVTGW